MRIWNIFLAPVWIIVNERKGEYSTVHNIFVDTDVEHMIWNIQQQPVVIYAENNEAMIEPCNKHGMMMERWWNDDGIVWEQYGNANLNI